MGFRSLRVKTLFDPVHGDDVFGHDDLYAALCRTMEMEAPPAVTDDGLDEYFGNLVERDREVFQKVLSGAVGRVDTIATDGRLSTMFEHTPVDGTATFDFAELLDEDRVIVFDFGGMEDRVKRALTLVLLSNLWTALKARSEATANADLPLVNLYLEEGADVAETQLVDTLLSQGRSFGLSVLLGVQFPEQLKSPDPTTETYLETLNEVATTVVGNVSVTDDLAAALATEEMDPEAVARRLSALQRGEWLVQPASPFGEPRPRPFLAESLSPPPGHPASDRPLTGSDARAFETAFGSARDRTTKTSGLEHDSVTPAPAAAPDEETPPDPASDPDAPAEEIASPAMRVDSLLPHTQRLPDAVAYDADTHSLRCVACEARYDPTIDGMRDAIECCHSLVDVDHDDVPICEINLKLAPEEIAASEWSVAQLLFLQAVYNAQQLRYDELEYDIVRDSMVRLREYVGIEYDAVLDLVDAGVLRDHGKQPHKLYSLAPEGREVIGESYTRGVEFGHGAGDLEESAQHVLLVELLRQYIVAAYEDDPESAVTEVVPYYELQEGEAPASAFMGEDEDASEVESIERRRLDVAGLDADGTVVVVGEAERLNNDSHEAIPADYDKMAACDPEEAIWATLTRTAAHEVLATLNDPADGEPRVEKTYSENTPARDFKIDTPGATEIYPLQYLRGLLEEE